MSTSDIKNKLSETADRAKAAAASAVDAATEAGRTAKDKFAAGAADTLDAARDLAEDSADDARASFFDAGDRIARGLQSHADETSGFQARVLNGLADGVSTVSDGLRGRTLGDLVTGAQDYARRNPGLVVAGAAVAGFALARFLRSSASAEQRAADATDRLYRDAARRTVGDRGSRS